MWIWSVLFVAASLGFLRFSQWTYRRSCATCCNTSHQSDQPSTLVSIVWVVTPAQSVPTFICDACLEYYLIADVSRVLLQLMLNVCGGLQLLLHHPPHSTGLFGLYNDLFKAMGPFFIMAQMRVTDSRSFFL